MQLARTIIGIVFICAALYVAAVNWGCVIVSLRNKRRGIDRYHSTVPLVTIILAFLALMTWPYRPNWWIIMIPILDIAHLNLVIWPIWWLFCTFHKRLSRK